VTEERLKHVATVRVSNVDKKSADGDRAVLLCNYTHVYYHEKMTRQLDFMAATATSDQYAVFGLRRDDVIITKDSETADDIGISAVVVDDVPDLVCGYHLAVVRARPTRAFGPYLQWTLASMPARQRMSAVATGVTRFGLRSEAIADIPIPLPPLSTQRAVADYLDRETARIDALIAAKGRMMELLEQRWREYRNGQFHLLDAPRVKLGRFVLSIGQGVSPEAEARPVEGAEWGVLKLNAVKAGRFKPSEHKTLPESFPPMPHMVPKVGDLLVTRANTPELVGDVCAVTIPTPRLILCDLIYVLRLRPALDPRYAAQALLTNDARVQLSSAARGTSQSMVKLRGEDVKATEIPLPTIDKQHAVVELLARESARVDAMSQRLALSIALLEERRRALIAAAVTGQLVIPDAA